MSIKLGCILLLVILFFGSTLPVLAATSIFPIRVLVGDDTVAPSIPTLQSVVPVTSNQIDVTWLPSTDNLLVAGYRVYRDGVVVATTTQTIFSDFGLTPSTTYAYKVDAFDSAFNVSSTSLELATTTPALPVVPPAPSSTVRRNESTLVMVPQLIALVVTSTERTALFELQMSLPVRYTVAWGRTTEYELGSLATNMYKATHQFAINGLEPGTQYFYKVTAIDARGNEQVVRENSFWTHVVTKTVFPTNVQQVVGVVQQHDVYLTWQNPSDLPPGTLIRVVRNYLFYPLSTTDGVVVYEGTGESFTDVNILSEHSPYFYTIFVITPDGYVSSGATFFAALTTLDMPSVSTSTPIMLPEIGTDRILRASDVLLNQANTVISFDQVHRLMSGAVTRLVIPKDALPPHLKSIMLTVYHPTNNTESVAYLLKLSPDGMQYEVTFMTPGIEGEAPLMLEVYDFTNTTVRRMVSKVSYVRGAEISMPLRWNVIITVLLLGVVVLWFLLGRLRREDN